MKQYKKITNPKGSIVHKNKVACFHATLKGSNVCRIGILCFNTTLKGSNVCRKNQGVEYSTPMGSHKSRVIFFYKHQIPSGLVTSEADIQKGLADLKEMM
jgi:hypothetical protein